MNSNRRSSNYDKRPVVKVPDVIAAGKCITGWDHIAACLADEIAVRRYSLDVHNDPFIVAIECYPGVDLSTLKEQLSQATKFSTAICTEEAFKDAQTVDTLVWPNVTDNEVFGYMTRLHVGDFFDPYQLSQARHSIHGHSGIVLVYGTGAVHFCEKPDLLVYADLARWEIQRRFRLRKVNNLGAQNKDSRFSQLYKRAFFVDWRVADREKKRLQNRYDFLLDTNNSEHVHLVPGKAMRDALDFAATRPIRLVPFFDPGPWGGQWMKEKFDLGEQAINFAWCFDCVPEENSLLLDFDGHVVEIPAINLVFYKPAGLMGEAVQSRFGDEFPIRFDMLDTVGGGNLSLQVHPITSYIQEQFGMHYTQDESYYLLDSEPGSKVYLGLKDDANPAQMMEELEEAFKKGIQFDADRFVASWPVKKHDHVLIPAGTVHCSGAGCMVLEISATPYIFTFKLYDWARMGLDGLPRPISLKHGSKVIDWSRREDFVKDELMDQVYLLRDHSGVKEERTGLHANEFIETRRHWFSAPVHHWGNGSVHVLNLIEGEEIVIESPHGKFEAFFVHYAETFIVPAAVSEYLITPSGPSVGKLCATIKAYVRL